MREQFGVSLFDVGASVSWGEAVSLARTAAEDLSTRLGAVLAGWAFPADTKWIVEMSAKHGKQAEKIMPWTLGKRQREREALKPTAEEVAEAEQALDDNIIIGG